MDVSPTKIRILHLSDLHVGEDWEWDYTNAYALKPGREGHDSRVLRALSDTLKDTEYDVVVVSGDISRNGSVASIGNAQQFIFGTAITPSGHKVGLDLLQKKIPTVVIPGNHDWFNGKWLQTSRSHYDVYQHLRGDPDILGANKPLLVRNVPIWFRCFDTCYSGGSWAEGYLQEAANLTFPHDRTRDGGVFIAVLHHHIIQHPTHNRHVRSEIKNAKRTLAYLLEAKFDLLMFGHTHDYFFKVLPYDALYRLLHSGGKKVKGSKRFKRLRKIFEIVSSSAPQSDLDLDPQADGLQYRRLRARNDDLISINDWIDYWYLKRVKEAKDLKRPATFNTPKQFHDYLCNYVGGASNLPSSLDAKQRRRIAISMAPSACQMGASQNGVTLLEISCDPNNNNRPFSIEAIVYVYDSTAGKFAPDPKVEAFSARGRYVNE